VSNRISGGVAGLATGAVATGVAHFVAGLTIPQASPVFAVGQAAIDLTPTPVKTFAISTFGSHDKDALLTGIGAVLFVFAAVIGYLTLRHGLRFGYVGLGMFGAIGLAAALTRPIASPSYAVPTLIGVAAGAITLRLLARTAAPPGPDSSRIVFGEPGSPPPVRREFLVGSGVAIAGAAVAGLAGRELATRSNVSAARTAVRFPRPAVTAPSLPAGTNLNVPGLAPFITPNGEFYRVDTALILSQVDPASWQLRIHGMVRKPVVISYAQLLKRPLLEDWITLCCVSNPVAGPYIGNAKWLGASLSSLVRAAGPQAGADQLLCTSVDGFTSGTPLSVVLDDGRDSLVAVAMNGAALPVAHGFPARLVVPGLYGYVSACKWVTDIEVTTFASATSYWAQRGWSVQAPIKTESRIDVPSSGSSVSAGRLTVAGIAWAQHKGVDAVEVRVDNGAWNVATLASVPGIDTWRQWRWEWDATSGSHVIEARATDTTGYTQTAAQAPVEPNGATGYPSINVTVR
jgi:DMSO/TMAO reductase YedYZ molybdopterin-dependent catalytic subunit